MKKMCKTLLRTIEVIVVYSLCLIYSIWKIYDYWTKYKTKFVVTKDHNVKPEALSNLEFGEHKFIAVNGVKLHYVEKGDTSKPLMLFIHGFPEFWYSWRYQILEFSKDYRTVAVDMRGYGDSDKPSATGYYAIDNMTKDIKCLIEALDAEKCILVCHDWGAVIGWNFLSHHMNMVTKYVMMGAPSLKVWRKNMTWEQFRMSWYFFYFKMPMLPEFTFSQNDYEEFLAIGSNKLNKNFTTEDLEAYKYTFSKPGALTGPINYYRRNLTLFGERRSPKITKYAPGLFILGENDHYISKSSGHHMQHQFQNLRFETVRDANHFVQQNAPENTNALIREFLKAS